MDPNLRTSLECIKPTHCAHCGYLLRGLPDNGRCPECGADFGSEDGIILFGWSQRLGVVRKAPLPILFWLAGAWAIWACLGALGGFFYPNRLEGMLVSVADITLAALPFSILLWLRAKAGTRAKPNSQVRLYADGYGQRSGFGPVRLMRWNPDIEVVVAREDEGIYRLQLERFGPAGGEDWAARVSLYFLADASAAAKLQGLIKQWQREGSTDP